MDEKFLKLTNAVYGVLEYFPESDPLKNRAKDKALAIFENPTIEDIDILLGYLWIGKLQGWFSSSNFLIIANEYEKRKRELEIHKDVVIKQRVIEEDKGHKGQDPPSYKITARQEQIIDFLSRNQKAQVMDLQSILPKVTKRTIRRDLDELMEKGKIIREGEFNQVFYKMGQDRTM